MILQVRESRGNAVWPQCDTASLQAELSTLWRMGEAVGVCLQDGEVSGSPELRV